MITCPKCNKELSDGSKFCDGCGAQIFETIFCPNCGEQTSTEFAFCQNCGAPIAEKPAADQPAAAPEEKKKPEAPKVSLPKNIPPKAIVFGGIGAAVLVVLILVVSLFSGGGSKNDYSLYLKDRELFFVDLKKDSKSWQLTSRFVDTGGIDNMTLSYVTSSLGEYIYMSEDGKYIFFPDKIDDGSGFNLYFREVSKPSADAVKIDSDVQFYVVNSAGTVVTYLKGDDGNLYQYTIRGDSKDKIASDVENFQVSSDGKKVVYVDDEGTIYLLTVGKDKEKIASDVSYVEYVSEDLKTVYYTKDDILYKQVEGQDKEKLVSDIYNVLKVYDSGEIYYLRSDPEGSSLMNYVVDDMWETDASITEPAPPNYPEYPSWWDYDSDAEFQAASDAYWAEYERLNNEYAAAYDVYRGKLYRDQLREELEGETFSSSSYSLCFFDGKEETVITDAYAGTFYSGYITASDAAVILYEAYNQSDFEKVKLSEIEDVWDVGYLVEAALFSSKERYVAVKGSDTVIEQEKEATSFRVNSDGTVIYYIDDIPDGKEYGDLYRISISGGKVSKPEVYDNDVYPWYCYFAGDDKLVYFKDYSDGEGELYVNKDKIDYDVSVYYVDAQADTNKVFYFTDWNDSKEYGTLKVYQGKDPVKIADDVHQFVVVSDGRVLYLTDYSTNYYRGDLYQWNKGKSKQLDDDVIGIVPVWDNEDRGYSYGW